MKLAEYFEQKSKVEIIFFGIIFLLFVSILDHSISWEYVFSIFYLMPITFVTWFSRSLFIGILFSTISALSWYSADKFTGHIYSYHMIPYWNTLVRFGFFYINVVSLLRISQAHNREREVARTDVLTQVSNSRHFFEILKYEVDRMNRNKQPLSIAYIDLDNFKIVNDKYGHTKGDNLLKIIAQTMKNSIRKTDFVARLAGDEFVLLFPETGLESAEVVVEKVRRNLLEKMQENNWPVTFSIGVGVFVKYQNDNDIESMITEVDQLMYEVKNSSKNGVKYKVFE